MYVDMTQFRLKFGSLLRQNPYRLCVVTVDIDGLLRVEFDGGEETVSPNDLPGGRRKCQ